MKKIAQEQNHEQNMPNSIRRRLLQGAALSCLAGTVGAAQALGQTHASADARRDSLNVLSFGAIGDGKTDNTRAFQDALNAAAAQGGGEVFAPAGQYLFKGHLSIPSYTSLVGIFHAPPAFVRTQGTVLLPTAGRGSAFGPPFLRMQPDSTLQGLAVYYKDQDENAAEPTPYPWTIAGAGDNVTVLDVALTNPYQGIALDPGGRHYIARVYGQPIAIGIYVNGALDVGRIENVHFWPFWTQTGKILPWIHANGVGLRFGRTDWQYVFNTFVFGYGVGYHFIQTKEGACSGNFLGIGSDYSGIAVVVEQTQERCGLLITNGEFVGDQRPDSQGIIVGPSNQGPVMLQNCGFWGPSDHIGTVRGTGSAGFIGCNFGDWDKNKTLAPAFVLDGGSATISSCQFLGAQGKLIARITRNCASAVVLGNTAHGTDFQVDLPRKPNPKRFQIAMNVTTE